MKGENTMSNLHAQLLATMATLSPEELALLLSNLSPGERQVLFAATQLAGMSPTPQGTHVTLDGDVMTFRDVVNARFDAQGAPFEGDDDAVAPLTIHAVIGHRTEWATGPDGMNRRRFVEFTGEDRTSWGIASLVVVYCPNPEAEFPLRIRLTASVGNGSQSLREMDAPIFRTSLEAREVLTPGVVHFPRRRAVAHLFGPWVDLVTGETEAVRATPWDEDGPAATAYKVAAGMQRGGGTSGKTRWADSSQSNDESRAERQASDEDTMSAEDEDLLSSLG